MPWSVPVAVLGANFLYHAAISAAGWVRFRRPAPSAPPTRRMAVVVPAHNEARVIAETVRSVMVQDYPAALLEVHVIADHCTDDTAAIARGLGATVHEREDAAERGKGHALAWLFPTLLEPLRAIDAVCVLDADNLMAPGFLREMDRQLAQGHAVVQGYLDTKNPGDSWVAANYAIAYWVSNRLFQLPRQVLGLNCALGGTGFVATAAILRAVPWRATCLTEDLEYSLQLVLRGTRVAWAHDAVVYDEKPLTLAASIRQRTRWMQGHWTCAGRYLRALLWMAVRRLSLRALDSAIYLLQPLAILGSVVSLAVTLVAPLVIPPYERGYGAGDRATAVLVLLLAVSLGFAVAHRRWSVRLLGHVLSLPLFGMTWAPAIVLGFLRRRRQVWAHTAHVRALPVEAMGREPP